MFLVNIITIIGFLIAYSVSIRFGVDWLKIIPGLMLLYYLPGHNLNGLLLRQSKGLSWRLRVPLDLLSSISLVTIFYFIFMSRISYRELPLVQLVVAINVVLAFSPLITKPIIQPLKSFFWKNKRELLVVLIPLCFFAIRLILNPYVYDIDSLLYFDAYHNILTQGTDRGVLFSGREAFPLYMISSNYVAGLGYIAFFKFVTPLLFLVGSISLLELLGSTRQKLVGLLAYLLIMASPMLTIMNESVRPETYSIAFALPVLVTIFLALKRNDIRLGLLAMVYSGVAYKFHESGFTILAAVGVGLVTLLVVNAKFLVRNISNKRTLSLAIAIPYALLLANNWASIKNFFNGGLSTWLISHISGGLTHISWRWWFLDNAVTVSGADLSWPGLSALYYYLYDGAILLVFTVVLLIALVLRWNTTASKPRGEAVAEGSMTSREEDTTLGYPGNFIDKDVRNNQRFEKWYLLLPLAVFTLFHLFYAELLPRLGTILLFNRSWPYISVGFIIFTVLLVKQVQNISVSRMKWVAFGLMFCVVSGTIGAIIGSTAMGAMVLPQEKTAIEAVKNLPTDSIIISTQRNHNLVKIYTGQQFYLIHPSFRVEYKADDNFSQIIRDQLKNTQQRLRDQLFNTVNISQITSNTVYYNGRLVDENAKSKSLVKEQEKVRLLQRYDPKAFSDFEDKLITINKLTQGPVYFLYSFAKLDHGLLRTRTWWRISSDSADYDYFKNYAKQKEAGDDNFVLIKVN